jgi:hypothetical protein
MATSFIAILELFNAFGLDVALIRRANATRIHFDTVWTPNICAPERSSRRGIPTPSSYALRRRGKLGSASFFVVRPVSDFYTMSHQNVTAALAPREVG